jgi:hypothetical protein
MAQDRQIPEQPKPGQPRRRRSKNLALAAVLAALVALFYAITLVKFGGS